MIKILLSAAVALMVSTSAWAAAPSNMATAPGSSVADKSITEQVRDHNRHDRRVHRDRRDRRHFHGGRYYAPGSRHAHAPRGWRRYSSRPSYWRTRGCVVVGPVWFCP